jgi:hypothetical protein
MLIMANFQDGLKFGLKLDKRVEKSSFEEWIKEKT